MAKKETVLLGLTEIASQPGFAICYARGSTFRKEGRLFRVEKGKRTVVNRALCLALYFGSRCMICPHRQFTVFLKPVEPAE